MRKSRGIAAFLMLLKSKMEEVSQNSFVLKLAGRQIDRLTTTTTTTTALKYYYNYKCKCITLPCATLFTLHPCYLLPATCYLPTAAATASTPAAAATASASTTATTTTQLQLQLQLHGYTLHYTNYTAVRYSYRYKCNYNYTTLHSATLH